MCNYIRDKPQDYEIDILRLLGIEFQKIDTYGYLVVRKGGMKMFAEKNKGNYDWGFKAENEDLYLSTKDFYKVTNDVDEEGIYRIHGYFFFETQYGESGAMILRNCNVYIPKHSVSTFKGFTEQEKDAIKNGECGITLHTYKSHNKKCVGINFADIDGTDVIYDKYNFDMDLALKLSDNDE